MRGYKVFAGTDRALGEVLKVRKSTYNALDSTTYEDGVKHNWLKRDIISLFGSAGARIELPGCSLCMGNQASVREGAVVFSTSTRNFDNRMGPNSKVYLGSAELAALCALLGRLPSVEEYMNLVPRKLEGKTDKVYQYLNFNLIEDYELGN